jgi:SAM-dependent methyltransferase
LQQGKLKGVCNVSGSDTEFIIYSDNLREDIVATASASINRHRQLICGLSMAVFGHPNGSLAGIAGHINQNNLRVYIAETNSVLSDFLRQNLRPHLFVCSEYFGSSHKSGDIVDGILHQDLQRTSFDDETFDIVITSEVFEHIPDAISAEIEVMRILKRGGVYCFTVPFPPASEHDLVLARMDEKGTVEHLAEPQFHDDRLRPDEGILVYRLFSFNDLKERFGAMGHEFKSTRFWSKSLGILGSACWTHTVRKNKNALNAS